MNYSEYKIASLKHLSTSEYMITNLTNLSLRNKLNILRNIYYLTGYSLECLINFWIFELLKRDGYRNSNVEALFYNYRGMEICYSRQRLTTNTGYWLNQHNFQRNSEVLNYLSNGNEFGNVPIIGDRNNEPFPNMVDLYDSWNVKVRYQAHPLRFPYDKGNLSQIDFDNKFTIDITNFVVTSRSIYDLMESIQYGRI